MLCHYKKIMELDKTEFIKLVRCNYSENAYYYPHDCEYTQENHAFYMYPNIKDKERNKKEEYNLIEFMLFNLAFRGIFVCELEAVLDKEVHYYTIIVK